MKAKGLGFSLADFFAGIFFSVGISFSGVALIVTAFELQDYSREITSYLPVDMTALFLWSLVISIVLSALHSSRFPWLVPVLLFVALLYHYNYGELRSSFEGLAYTLSKRYNKIYHCGTFLLDKSIPRREDLLPALCTFVSIMSASVTWATCRKQSAFWVLVACLLCMIPCTIITTTVPDVKIIFLFLLMIILFLLTQHNRLQSSSQGLRLLAIVAVPTVVLFFLFFQFTPKEGYEKKDVTKELQKTMQKLFVPSKEKNPTKETEEQHVSISEGVGVGGNDGNQDYIDLENVGNLIQRRIAVMYVTAPKSELYYLRGCVYSKYTGTSWEMNPKVSYLPWLNADPTGEEMTIVTRQKNEIMYMPYCADPELFQTYDLVRENPEKETEYSYSCFEPGTALAGSVDNTDLTNWTGLPVETHQWASELVQSLDYGDRPLAFQTNEQVAQAIESYVEQSATYHLSTPPMNRNATDFARWFLEESDTGYCVHFASSAVVLLRAAGIPARYVTGYMFRAKAGQETTVYQKDAHAWVEFWTPNGGWQILDPTPSSGEDSDDVTESESEEQTTTTRSTTEPTQIPSSSEVEQDPAAKTEDSRTGGFWRILKWILLILFLPGALIGQWQFRLFRHKKARITGSPNARALRCWGQVLSYSSALKEKPDRELKRLAQKAKFSQHELSSEELDAFERYFRASVETMKKHSWYRRIYYRFVLALF